MVTKKFFSSIEAAEVTFEFKKDGVESVSILGDFNEWQPQPMKFSRKYKTFRVKIRLPKNQKFHFRYLINSRVWENDSHADYYAPNEFGTDNSVVITSAK